MEGFDRGWRDPEETADSESKWPMREWGGSWDVSLLPSLPSTPFHPGFSSLQHMLTVGKSFITLKCFEK